MLDEWFQTAPYQSAFCVTAFKATLADFITQSKEQQAFNDLVKAEEDEDFAGKGESKFLLVDSVVPFDEEVGAGQVKVAKMQTIVEYDAMSYVVISKPSKQIVCDEFQCVEIEPEPEGLCLSRLGTFFLYGGQLNLHLPSIFAAEAGKDPVEASSICACAGSRPAARSPRLLRC